MVSCLKTSKQFEIHIYIWQLIGESLNIFHILLYKNNLNLYANTILYETYCVVNTKVCPVASILGPGALGALNSLVESGVAGAQNKQNIYIYIYI